MINNYFIQQIKTFSIFKFTDEQEIAIKLLTDFLFSTDQQTAFVLKGYAGTGKTSIVAAVVKTMQHFSQKVVLLAPTGRSAKTFSHAAAMPASTIHKKIYRQKVYVGTGGVFVLSENLHKNTLFIVDEASMLAAGRADALTFGSGRLLDDLIQYVYAEPSCKLLLIGDPAQLPPVGEVESPALSLSVLSGYGLQVATNELTQVMRQLENSGILWNATALRQLIRTGNTGRMPPITVSRFTDVVQVQGSELIETLAASYDSVGMDETMVISRSNKRATIYNEGIRNQLLFREESLSSGDYLMVAKNNYFWSEKCKELDFIANGDIVRVKRVRNTRELYGFHFADVELDFIDYEHLVIEVTVLLDTLHAEAPALSKQQQEELYTQVWADYAFVTTKTERIKKLKNDIYFNALQIKFAYAVTCHKAQGGQWQHVYLDQGYIPEEQLTSDYYRWLYTAMTRASEKLFLVNYPSDLLL